MQVCNPQEIFQAHRETPTWSTSDYLITHIKNSKKAYITDNDDHQSRFLEAPLVREIVNWL